MQGNNLKDQDASKLNRRKFLTKTGASFFIASMPAKSVWGACSVSGALSGNLSQNNDRHDCEMPRIVGGRSPGGWKNYESGNNRPGKVKAFFANSTDLTFTCYDKEVKLVKSFILPLPADLVSGVRTIEDGLKFNGTGDNNILCHLSAVYLNAYFGFYTDVSKSQAAELVKKIFTAWYVRNITLNMNDNVDNYFKYYDEIASNYRSVCK
ncbi:hypothetical protein [Alishewanella tabrizica]|uniref:Uncharacterized protein n=1 Tax=Alishewanella tabrizica TaxID=671278 RepID=A0ABQ2WFA9_9ALTE|nr:hypothetical protein [Alishewanella tabrizica]GGW53308.1 hypothetical protein GCM10008111_06870 [Alishewanella tabrizica]